MYPSVNTWTPTYKDMPSIRGYVMQRSTGQYGPRISMGFSTDRGVEDESYDEGEEDRGGGGRRTKEEA